MSKPVCIVIGMGPGISYSTAKLFGSNGFRIVMVARNKDKLDELESEFSKSGLDVASYLGDAADFDNLRSCLAEIKENEGVPEIMVYNVSVYREANPTELSAEVATDDFRANVGGALVSLQAFADDMKTRGSGTIFLTGGGQGLEPMPLLSSLGIGKAGLRNLAYSVHKELEPHNIKVATVTINGMVAKNTPYDPDIIADLYWELHSADIENFQREIIVE